MILKGLSMDELKGCVEKCQSSYDNNLTFNRLGATGYKKNVRGIEAVAMEDSAIIAKDNGKPYALPVFSRYSMDSIIILLADIIIIYLFLLRQKDNTIITWMRG